MSEEEIEAIAERLARLEDEREHPKGSDQRSGKVAVKERHRQRARIALDTINRFRAKQRNGDDHGH
jgi:hypothetical protein